MTTRTNCGRKVTPLTSRLNTAVAIDGRRRRGVRATQPAAAPVTFPSVEMPTVILVQMIDPAHFSTSQNRFDVFKIFHIF